MQEKILSNKKNGMLVMLFPLSSTFPLVGCNNLENVFSMVDFPHPFAPSITLILFSGTVIVTSEIIFLPSYPALILSAFNIYPFNTFNLVYSF